jgi:hypothetical protein
MINTEIIEAYRNEHIMGSVRTVLFFLDRSASHSSAVAFSSCSGTFSSVYSKERGKSASFALVLSVVNSSAHE